MKMTWPKFERGDPMLGAFIATLFFMTASFTFEMYCLILVYLTHV